MRKFLVLFILVFVFVLPTFAKSFSDFEDPIANTRFPLDPWVQYRALGTMRIDPVTFDTTHLVSVVENVKWATLGGHHAAEIRMDTSTGLGDGMKWLLMCKARWEGEANALDTNFLPGVGDKDTIFYYLWIPCDAPIDSIFIFARDTDWTQDPKTVYHKADLNFGCWNELFDRVDSTSAAFVFPLVQCDFEIHTDASLNVPGTSPSCTLYFDCPSSLGPILQSIGDTAGQIDNRPVCNTGAVEMPEEGDGALSVSKTSINCIEYAINVNAPVMIRVYNLAGQKIAQFGGIQAAGSYSIPLPPDLDPGVYYVLIAAGTEEKSVKVISAR